MPSVIISSDTKEVSESIARKVAEKLEYEYVGVEILDKIVERHGIPRKELVDLVERVFDGRGRLSRTGKEYMVYLQEAVVEQFERDNIVCEGLAAHLFLRDIPHVLSVRVLSDLRIRHNKLAAQKNISPRRARRILEKEDRRRQQWSMRSFGFDETNPSLYDFVVYLNQIEESWAVKMVTETADDRRFRATTYSRKCVQEEILACHVRTALAQKYPEIRVTVQDGKAVLHMGKAAPTWLKNANAIRKITYAVDGVESVELRKEKILAAV